MPLRRLVREVQSYKDESAQTKAKADEMEARGEDEYEVRQQVRCAPLPFLRDVAAFSPLPMLTRHERVLCSAVLQRIVCR